MTEDRSKLYARIWEEAHGDLGITSVAASKGEPPRPPAPLLCAALDRIRAEARAEGAREALAVIKMRHEDANLDAIGREFSADPVGTSARYIREGIEKARAEGERAGYMLAEEVVEYEHQRLCAHDVLAVRASAVKGALLRLRRNRPTEGSTSDE